MIRGSSEFAQQVELTLETAVKLKALMLKQKKTFVWTNCPKCGKKLYGRLSGRKNHLHMHCETSGCLAMME